MLILKRKLFNLSLFKIWAPVVSIKLELLEIVSNVVFFILVNMALVNMILVNVVLHDFVKN